VLTKDHIILASMESFDLYCQYVGFMEPGKPSSLVTIFTNRPSLLQGGLLEGE
jgi:hypothetical protein